MEGKRQKDSAGKFTSLLTDPSSVKPRQCEDWIFGFEKYISALASSDLYKRWAGISTLAAVLERRVWVRTNIGPLYPNLYVILVGPAGIGKGIVLNEARNFMLEAPGIHLAPSSVSRASLADALVEAERKIVVPQQMPSVITYNSLTAVVNELGTFLTEYDGEFVSALQDLWDCKHYQEKKRTNDVNINLKTVQLNLLAGDTVAHLLGILPDGAWDQGFLSRSILIYSGEMIIKSLFNSVERDEELKKFLEQDIKSIAQLYGEIYISPQAVAAIDAWHQLQGPPRPDHPKLQHYNSRRTSQLLKLCMIVSVSRGSDYTITIDDYARALEYLLSAERFMMDIFKAYSIGGDGGTIKDIIYYVTQIYYRRNMKPLKEEEIIAFIQNKTPSHAVMRVYELLFRSGLLQKNVDGIRPTVREEDLT